MNYGRGVGGNAALNTVVMCLDLRKRSAGQDPSGRCADLLGNPVGDAGGHGHECPRVRPRARRRVGLTVRTRRGAGRGLRDEIHRGPAPGSPCAPPARGAWSARPRGVRRGDGRSLVFPGGTVWAGPPARFLPGPAADLDTDIALVRGRRPAPGVDRGPLRTRPGQPPSSTAGPSRGSRPHRVEPCRDVACYAPQCPFWVAGLWAGPAIPDDDRGRDAGETTTIQPPNGR